MEVATGEHGEWVHKLVMAVNKGSCGREQPAPQPHHSNFNNQQKTNNTDKPEAVQIAIGNCFLYNKFFKDVSEESINREK